MHSESTLCDCSLASVGLCGRRMDQRQWVGPGESGGLMMQYSPFQSIIVLGIMGRTTL